MADETIEQRVERLSRETGGSDSTPRTPEEVQQQLDQNWDYVLANGPARVQMRKQAYQDAGLEPPVSISKPGTKELNERGPVHTYVRPGLEAAGMALGGIAGSGLGPIGTATGAALGYAGGDALSSFVERMAGERPPIQSVPQAATETLNSLSKGMLLEGGGQATAKIGSKLLAPFAGQYEKNKTLDEIAKGRGVQLDPHEILQSRPLALGHKVLENVPFTSGMVQRQELEKLGALTKEWQDLRDKTGAGKDRARLGDLGLKIQTQVDKHLDAIGVKQEEIRSKMRDEVLHAAGSPVTYKELGDTTQKAITDHYQGLKMVEDSAWNYARESVPETGRVVTNNLAKEAKAIQGEYENIPSFLQEPLLSQLKDVQKSGNPAYDKFLGMVPQGLSQDAHKAYLKALKTEEQPGWGIQPLLNLRRELSDLSAAHHSGLQRGDAKQGSSDAYGRIYTRLLKAVDADIQAFADANGTDMANRFKLARVASGERMSLFNPKDNPWVVKAIDSEAQTLHKTLIQPGNAAGYTALKEKVGERAVQPVKKAFTNSLLDVGGKEEEGLSGLLTKLNRYGKQTLEEVYTPAEVKQLYELADKANWMKKSPIGNPFFRELVKTAPAKVAPTILEHPDLTAKVLRTFPNMKQSLRQAFVEGLHPNQQTPFPTQLMKTLNAYPKDVQRQLFSQDELKDFYEIARVIERTKGTVKLAENPSGTAQNLVTFATAGALIKHPLANAPQAIGTASVAKLYLSKTGRRYLLQGLVTPSNSEKAIELASKIGGIAGLDFADAQQLKRQQPRQ